MSRDTAAPAVLSAALAVIMGAGSVAADAASYATPVRWNLEVLGAQRLPDQKLDEARTPARVGVLTAGEIQRSGARTLQEAIRLLPGVVAFDQMGNSMQETVDLRGFNATPVPSVAVVVDGVRVNEPDFGQVNWQLIPLETVARIEVFPGPSTVHGKNALGGVIHITTKRGGPARASGESGAGAGGSGRRKAWAGAGGALGRLDWRVTGTKERDGGWRRHSAADVGAVALKAGWKADEGSDVALGYTHVDDALEQAGSLTEAEAAQDPRQNVSEAETVSRLDFFTWSQRQALPFGFSAALQGHVRERRESTPLNRGRSSLSRADADMVSRGMTLQLSREDEPWGLRTLAAAGGERGVSRADSDVSGAFGGWPFRSSKTSREESSALFFQDTLDLVEDAVSLTAGVRYDENRVGYQDRVTPANAGEARFHRTTPRFGLNLGHPDGYSGYALYSEGFRTPTVDEIASLGPFGDSPLRPVRARNYELGARLPLGEAAELRAAAFRTDVQDEIFPVFDPTAGYGRNINVERTRRTGVEWSARAAAGAFEARFDHSYTRATFEAPMTLDKAPWPATQSVKTGDSLPMVPRHRLGLRLSARAPSGLSGAWSGRCVSSRRFFGDEGNTEASLGGHCLMDLGSAFERGPWRFFVDAHNLLDRRYPARGILATDPASGQLGRFVVPGPGRSVFGGVAWRFQTGTSPEQMSYHLPDGDVQEQARALAAGPDRAAGPAMGTGHHGGVVRGAPHGDVPGGAT